MHTFRGRTCIINYNSDMSGDITIVTEKGELDVSGEDILKFVSTYIVSEKISQLENSDPLELLKSGLKL